VLQAYFLHHTGFQVFSADHFFFNGGWVSHLWFLINLIVYFTVAAFLAWSLERPISQLGKRLAEICDRVPLSLVVAAMPLSAIAVLASGTIGVPLYRDTLGVLSMYSLLIYAPYFVFGAVLATQPRLLYKFATIPPLLSVSIIVGSVIVGERLSMQSGFFVDIAQVYFTYLAIWFAIAVCFYVFHAFFNTYTNTLSFLSDASYTVYLFHHLLVIVIGYAIIQLNLHPLPSLVVLIVTVAASAILAHKLLVLRFPILRLLYNGK
jgi:glucan biosynthesis protein C